MHHIALVFVFSVILMIFKTTNMEQNITVKLVYKSQSISWGLLAVMHKWPFWASIDYIGLFLPLDINIGHNMITAFDRAVMTHLKFHYISFLCHSEQNKPTNKWFGVCRIFMTMSDGIVLKRPKVTEKLPFWWPLTFWNDG